MNDQNTLRQATLAALLIVAAAALLWVAYPAEPLLLLPLTVVAIVAAIVARLGYLRPLPDVIAWGAVITLLATLPGTSQILIATQTLILTILAITALLAGIHVPPNRAAQPGPTMGTPGWLLVVTLIALAAWWPTLRAPQGDVIVWDPLSPTGAAIRVLGTLTLLALASGILSAVSLLSQNWKEQKNVPGNHDATPPSEL